MTVRIRGIAYAPVENEIDDEDIWLQSSRNLDIDRQVVDIFRSYLVSVIEKKDTQKVSVGHFEEGEGESGVKGWLDEIRDMSLDLDGESDDYIRFEELTESFANRLMGEMDYRSSGGVLFVIRGVRQNVNFVGLLKLDLDDEQRSVLDHETNELKYEELNRVLPQADSLQKGCIYPVFQTEQFDLDGDVKFLQEDSPSAYFETFLGCLNSSASLSQAKNIMDAFEDYKLEKTGQGLAPNDIRNFENAITTTGGSVATNENIHEGAEEVLGDEYDETEIDDMLVEANEVRVNISPDNAPKSVEFTIDDDIHVEAPISALDGDRITVSEPNNDGGSYEIIVRGTSLDKSFKK